MFLFYLPPKIIEKKIKDNLQIAKTPSEHLLPDDYF